MGWPRGGFVTQSVRPLFLPAPPRACIGGVASTRLPGLVWTLSFFSDELPEFIPKNLYELREKVIYAFISLAILNSIGDIGLLWCDQVPSKWGKSTFYICPVHLVLYYVTQPHSMPSPTQVPVQYSWGLIYNKLTLLSLLFEDFFLAQPKPVSIQSY